MPSEEGKLKDTHDNTNESSVTDEGLSTGLTEIDGASSWEDLREWLENDGLR